MPDWVGADVAALQATQPRFDDLASSVAAIEAHLASALDAEGACWGEDEAGRGFASEYLPATAALRSLLTGTSSGIRDLGAALGRVARGFAVADGEAGRPWRGD